MNKKIVVLVVGVVVSGLLSGCGQNSVPVGGSPVVQQQDVIKPCDKC